MEPHSPSDRVVISSITPIKIIQTLWLFEKTFLLNIIINTGNLKMFLKHKYLCATHSLSCANFLLTELACCWLDSFVSASLIGQAYSSDHLV